MDILHALGLAASLAIAYAFGNARRLYREEEWLDGVRYRLDAWDEADPLGDSSEVVESPGKAGLAAPPSPSADPSIAWFEGYRVGQRSAIAFSPGIRERLAAGEEGGREVERGRVLG